MINFNGQITTQNTILSTKNRAFLYGDGVFETLKIVNNKILFFEDHYFRLMASMRILRMQIPMNFTMEFIENEILTLVIQQNISNSARVRMTVFRNDGGFYLPENKSISYIIEAVALENKNYLFEISNYEVDLYKDFYISNHLLSTLKTTNRLINITGSIFAKENDFKNCILINHDKNVVEFLNGNLFMLLGNKLITPPIKEGCINGIMRKQILLIAKKIDGIEVAEQTISPFDLQKANELFCTNIIIGVQPIFKYRKKEYHYKFAEILVQKLNQSLV